MLGQGLLPLVVTVLVNALTWSVVKKLLKYQPSGGQVLKRRHGTGKFLDRLTDTHGNAIWGAKLNSSFNFSLLLLWPSSVVFCAAVFCLLLLLWLFKFTPSLMVSFYIANFSLSLWYLLRQKFLCKNRLPQNPKLYIFQKQIKIFTQEEITLWS